MPTIKKRINLTVDENTHKILEEVAKYESKPISTLGLELIEQALDLREDYYFSKEADERSARLAKKLDKKISHEEAWK